MTLKKIDHTFKNKQLSYDACPNYQPCIKLSFYFNKLPHVSNEHFHRHWETIHADLTVATKPFKSNKVQRYVQVHQGKEIKDKIAGKTCHSYELLCRRLTPTASGADLNFEHLDFDGCSEFWFKKWEDWLDFCSSSDYLENTAPDCKNFMAMPIKV